jgi:hypothetical protein
LKRVFVPASVVAAIVALTGTGSAGATTCTDTANGSVCAGQASNGFSGAYGYNKRGYFESGRGGGCGYHFEFGADNKYVGQC